MESQGLLNIDQEPSLNEYESSLSSLGNAIRISIDPGFPGDSGFDHYGEAFLADSNVRNFTIASNSEKIRAKEYPIREHNDQTFYSNNHENRISDIMELEESNPQLAENNANISGVGYSNIIAATEECSDPCTLNTVVFKTGSNIYSSGEKSMKSIGPHTMVSDNSSSHLLPPTLRKRYQCEYCEKSFYSKVHEERHSRVHTGEKPFRCVICNKAFSRKDHLSSHLRTHTFEKPFNCEICNEAFSQSSSLKRHMLIHLRIKTFQCKDCGKAFIRKHTLMAHAVVHSEEKPFKCKHCNATFSYKQSLVRHEKNACYLTINQEASTKICLDQMRDEC